MRRRDFVGVAAGAAVLRAEARPAAIFVMPEAARAPIDWAVEELKAALEGAGFRVRVRYNLDEVHNQGERIIVAPGASPLARQIAGAARVRLPSTGESLAIAAGRVRNEPVLLVTGADVRGVMYGVLELADRVQCSADAAAALRDAAGVVEQPVNPVRSVARLFVSELEDKPWFYDRAFWKDYLGMLAAQRFNRFSLSLGLGYDLPRNVLDAYFIFAYPFLLEVPGYRVSVSGRPPEEPARNLAMLQWISAETARRGLHFQLGLWSHTYQWIDSPKANYRIEGLTPATHGAYCRDALRTLLRACPAISGITFRAHSESGIPDGSYEFWRTVFAGVADCGRRVEMDLHSKGIDFRQIRMALETGQPVCVSPKLTAEHMGLPYHQIAIRELERTRPSSTPQDRSFTRYGYADYLADDRAYGVYFRIWPGKDKVLLWADPALAAGYGRSAGFCGSLGLELCEPLTFKGRQGSGASPERRIYADDSLRPRGGDWRKYVYQYRLWGRHLYNPDAPPECYRRSLRREFGNAAPAVESALSLAGRVTPLITSAHLPSASAMTYWLEMYTNMPITDAKIPHPYGDTPSPKVFGRVSPLDPGLFSTIEEFAGRPSDPRYSPVDVAAWLERFASGARERLPQIAAFRREAIDTEVYCGLALFFAWKLRARVAYATKDIGNAVAFYRKARQAWDGIVKITRGVYVEDLGFGQVPNRRGHWADRMAAIDQDLRYMEELLQGKPAGGATPAWLRPRPPIPVCRHEAPARFEPGRALELELAGKGLSTVTLHYRHVNQAEAYETVKMTGSGGRWRGAIPAAYAKPEFPLMYYFELRDGAHAWLYPGLGPDLAGQPYFVVRRATRA